MSWNGGFNYFQPGPEQPGRNRASYTDSSSGNSASYHRPTYSSLTTTPPTPQYPSTQSVPDPSSDAYHGSGHPNFTSSSNGEYNLAVARPQSHGTSAAMNSYPTTVRSWGNLAYASSLGHHSRNHASPTREDSSLQRIVDYNHSHPSSSYADSSAYGMTESITNHYADNQPHSVGGATTRDNARSTEPSNSYVTSYTMYASDGNHQTQPRPSSQGKRTAQMTKGPDSSSRMADKVSTTTSSRITSNSVRGSELSQTQQQSQSASKPQSWHEWSNADLNAPPPGFILPTSGSVKKTSNLKPQKPLQANANSAASSSPNVQDQRSRTQGQKHKSQSRLETQRPTPDIRANGDNPEERTQAENQYPTTVNPNETFDNASYQNSRAAAAAAKAEAVRIAAENAAAKKAEAESSTHDTGADSAAKDQMELEMKQMIEKMRSFQSKDPTLFKQVLEKVSAPILEFLGILGPKMEFTSVFRIIFAKYLNGSKMLLDYEHRVRRIGS